MSGTVKYLFVDRDGTLIEEPADFQIDSLEKFRLVKGVVPALLKFSAAGYRLVMITNQDGLGSVRYPQETFDTVQRLLLQVFESQGLVFDEILICPHLPEDRCLCRKPAPGLVMKYLASAEMDRARSLVVGDRATDVDLARNMGIEGQLLTVANSWTEIARAVLDRPRSAEVRRETKETRIRVRVDIDGVGRARASTGIGFFDHMLEQISKHSGCDVDVECVGDVRVDDHHTVEDVALALGAAFRQALGDKFGIERFGFFLPMDEASAQVAIDLSGRAFSRFEGGFDRPMIGEMATEMVPHFFRSFAEGLQANVHVKIQGDNTHHRVESAFKALGRSLRQAVARGSQPGIPSTKGSL